MNIGFILSTYIVHYRENVFTKWFYIVFGIWIGVLLNFLFIMTVLFFVYKVVLRFFKKADVRIFGVVGVIFTVVLSCYGVWNTYYNLQVKEITVTLKNLPEEWKGKKAVQISDVHLGVVYGEDFLNRVVAKINELKPDIVFITGDFFDGMDGDLKGKASALKNLKVPNGIYFVTGNHENYLGVAKAEEALNGFGVTVLHDEMVNLNGLQIVGLNYKQMLGAGNVKKIMEGMKNFDRNKSSILLYHGPQGIAEAKAAGINLQLSGHAHKGQIFPIGLIVRLIFGKYYYGLNTEGDYSIYTTSGTGGWGPTMRTSGNSEIVLINLE